MSYVGIGQALTIEIAKVICRHSDERIDIGAKTVFMEELPIRSLNTCSPHFSRGALYLTPTIF